MEHLVLLAMGGGDFHNLQQARKLLDDYELGIWNDAWVSGSWTLWDGRAHKRLVDVGSLSACAWAAIEFIREH